MARVDWLKSAENELADYWTRADSAGRQAISAASQIIDHRLAIDPLDEAESRHDDTRITFEYPLPVRFEVSPDRRVVTVLHVRHYGPPR